jgi:hypothetical protein
LRAQALKDENIIIQTLLSSAGEDDTTVDKCWITGRDAIKKAAEEVVGTKQMEVRRIGLMMNVHR